MKENKNYWMHRITHEREVKEALLNDEGLLLTGWGAMSNDSFLENVLGKGKPVEQLGQDVEDAIKRHRDNSPFV